MECKQIIKLMEEIAPCQYKEDWDNVGLLVGRDTKEVKRILVALDPTENVIRQAVKNDIDMLITHHPLIFSGLKRINCNDYIGKKVYELASHDISYYATHTNMDSAVMADVAAGMLNMVNTRPLSVSYRKKMYKLAVYVPKESADKVRDAMSREGAGHIGAYSHCTFNTEGVGTFKALEGTNPYVGVINELTRVTETKIECVVTDETKDAVIKAMIKVHPYEEVAYDLYELENTAYEKGIGKIGYLSHDMTLEECAELVKEKFGIDTVRIVGNPHTRMCTAAVSPGAGKSMVKEALKAKVDVLITGDIDHHSAIDAVEQGLCIIDAGHFGTEHFVVEYIRNYLIKCIYNTNDEIFSNTSGVEVLMAEEKSPFVVM